MHLLVSLLPDFFPLFFLRGGGSRLLLVVDAVVFIIQSTLSPIKRAHDAPDDLYDIVFDIDGWRRSDIGPPLDGMVSKQKQKSNRNGRTDGRWEKGEGGGYTRDGVAGLIRLRWNTCEAARPVGWTR